MVPGLLLVGKGKFFASEQSDFTIKLYGVSSKKIVIQADNNEGYLKLLFEKLVSLHEASGVVPRVSEVHVRESDRFNKQTVCCCNCTCSSNVTRAEINRVN